MTLPQLSYIVAVDDFKSFQLAAKNKFVTQPTLSMQIQKLEDELGVVIFDRSKHPVKTTDIGNKIIRQARNILAETSKLHELVKFENESISGEFKLGIIPTVAPYLLPLFLEDFVNKYPEIDLIIDEIQTSQIIDKLRKDELDAAILATPLHEVDIEEIPLYYEPFEAYVSRKHRLFEKDVISPDDLDLHDLFLLKEGHCFRDHVVQICKTYVDAKNPVVSALNFEGGTLDTLMKLVEKNFGMTLIPYLHAREIENTEKRVYLKRITSPEPRREISIIHRKIFQRKQVLKILKEEILNYIPKELFNSEQSMLVG